MNRHERRAAAKGGKLDSKARPVDDVAAVYSAVVGELRVGRYLEAQMRCQRGLEASPEHPELLHLMALVCFNAGQIEHAFAWASRAVEREPKPAYLTTLGTLLLNLRRHDEAIRAFQQAVQIKGDDAGLWSSLGNALIEAGRLEEALVSFQRALKLDPSHLDATFKSGVILHQQDRFDEALTYLNACETMQPNQSGTLILRGTVLNKLNRFEEALSDNQRAHALNPQSAYACKNLGFSLMQLGRYEEAITAYRASKTIDPDCAETDWNFGLLKLLLGDFEAGWAGREARFRMPSSQAWYPDFPERLRLRDENVNGKTILIYADEGMGDTIQFARYIPLLAARGARIILVVDEPVRSLLSGLAGVVQCLGKPLYATPPFDLHCPICSLPLVFGTRLETIPAATSYLPAPVGPRVQAWEQRLGAHEKLRVGLVWSGNPSHTNDHNRSLPLRALLPILDVGATFVSLQKNPRPDDQAMLDERTDIIDLTSDLTDFSATAALVSCLDLVITVDTSVAHLSGALGRPTWVLLSHRPDYRWLLGRDDSPWYPTVRLFRQAASRDYEGVLARVRAELATLAAAFPGPATAG